MAAPSSIPEFLDLVRRSGVVEDDRLQPYLEQLKEASGPPPAPTKFAGQLVRDGVLTHFQAEQFLAGKWKRFSIGKYKVLERLGSGGMGQVFLCEHKLMRRRVAVKVLPTNKAEDPASLERFYREARAIAALDHPNLVRAFDIDEDDQLHFLVMEYVDGASLQEMIKKHGPMESLRAAHYLHQSAVGLDYAHKVAGLVHRDIKPGNILVDRTGVVKILDMGLARFFNDETDVLTRKYDDNILGTADYLAPEQAIDSHSVDIRADLYSLGATFYFVLVGHPPFPDGTMAQKLIWHQSKQPKKLAELRPDLPPELVRIIERMMCKDKTDRYTTPAELADDLAPLTAVPIPPPPEIEMPQLSLAALAGAVPVPVNPRAVAARLPGGPRGIGPPGSSSMLARPPVSGFTPQTPPPRSTVDAASTRASSDTEPSANPFSQLLTEKPGSSARSAPGILESVYAARAVAAREAVVDSPVAPVNTNRLWLAVATGALAIAAFAGAWWLTNRDNQSKLPPSVVDKTSSGRELIVDPDGSGDGFRQVIDAIRKAQPGDRILIKSLVLQETLKLDGRSLARGNITIESGRPGGSQVLWTAPANASSAHLVDLQNCEGLHFKNIVFDGQGRVETLVRLSGRCAGTTLEQVHLRNFTRAGVRYMEALGEVDRPISLLNCRLQSSGPGDYGVRLTGSTPGKPVKFVQIADCRFEGPYQAAILGEGSAAELTIERNRIFRTTVGVRWQKFDKDQYLKAKIVNNTFVEVANAAVHFESAPTASTVAFRLNLAARCGEFMDMENNDAVGFVNGANNVRDTSTKDGALPQPANQVDRVDFLSLDPGNREFLRYSRSSTLATAGDGGPVGAPPE